MVRQVKLVDKVVVHLVVIIVKVEPTKVVVLEEAINLVNQVEQVEKV